MDADSEVTRLFETESMREEFGVIRIEKWPEGIVLWVGGEIRWRSWRDPALWSVRGSHG